VVAQGCERGKAPGPGGDASTSDAQSRAGRVSMGSIVFSGFLYRHGVLHSRTPLKRNPSSLSDLAENSKFVEYNCRRLLLYAPFLRYAIVDQ
jgi:hypothetical protein